MENLNIKIKLLKYSPSKIKIGTRVMLFNSRVPHVIISISMETKIWKFVIRRESDDKLITRTTTNQSLPFYTLYATTNDCSGVGPDDMVYDSIRNKVVKLSSEPKNKLKTNAKNTYWRLIAPVHHDEWVKAYKMGLIHGPGMCSIYMEGQYARIKEVVYNIEIDTKCNTSLVKNYLSKNSVEKIISKIAQSKIAVDLGMTESMVNNIIKDLESKKEIEYVDNNVTRKSYRLLF